MLHHTGYLKNQFNITTEEYQLFILQHILEYLTFVEIHNILNYLYFTENLTEFEKKVKQIYDDIILHNKGYLELWFQKKTKDFFW